MNHDPIFNSFLQAQFDEGLAFARESDVVELMPAFGSPPSKYMATFHGEWLAQDPRGQIVGVPLAVFGIAFPRDYLRCTEVGMIATVLEPHNLWHPNISGPFVCLGHLVPGMSLVDILYQCFEVLAYFRHSPASPLNEAAAQWARNQPAGRFPTDRRALFGKEAIA